MRSKVVVDRAVLDLDLGESLKPDEAAKYISELKKLMAQGSDVTLANGDVVTLVFKARASSPFGSVGMGGGVVGVGGLPIKASSSGFEKCGGSRPSIEGPSRVVRPPEIGPVSRFAYAQPSA